MTTTDLLENALAFADADKHEGDLRIILHQAKSATVTLAAEVRRLQAIVDVLPKDADDELLNTHTRYWWTKRGKVHTGYLTMMEDSITAISWAPGCPGAYHTSREAAEAARGNA